MTLLSKRSGRARRGSTPCRRQFTTWRRKCGANELRAHELRIETLLCARSLHFGVENTCLRTFSPGTASRKNLPKAHCGVAQYERCRESNPRSKSCRPRPPRLGSPCRALRTSRTLHVLSASARIAQESNAALAFLCPSCPSCEAFIRVRRFSVRHYSCEAFIRISVRHSSLRHQL